MLLLVILRVMPLVGVLKQVHLLVVVLVVVLVMVQNLVLFLVCVIQQHILGLLMLLMVIVG